MNTLNTRKRVSITVPPDAYGSISELAERFSLSMDKVGSKLALLGLKLLKDDPEQAQALCPCHCDACRQQVR